MELECSFEFFNVGHGLFYLGKIKVNDENKEDEFTFIYDCGTLSSKKYLNRCINHTKIRLSKKHIDLLILSHLHKDHVNGIYKLLNDFSVDTVVLPYLNLSERLILALSSLGEGIWYRRFLANPLTYLLEDQKVKEIVILYDKEYDKEIEKELELEKVKKEKRISMKEKFFKTTFKTTKNKIFWVFDFFNYRISPSNLQNFIRCIDHFLGNPSTITERFEKIKETIKDRNKLKQLKNECYSILTRDLKRDLNSTSLVLFHKPSINFKRIEIKGRLEKIDFNKNKLDYVSSIILDFSNGEKSAVGQLLTGDINLNLKHKANELFKWLSNRGSDVFMVQVPHHGSKYSWNRGILLFLPNALEWIISSGISWFPPSKEVIEDIIYNKKSVRWVNEISNAEYFFKLSI